MVNCNSLIFLVFSEMKQNWIDLNIEKIETEQLLDES